MKPVRSFRVREYINVTGRSPFREWVDSLSVVAKARIQVRILRIESGNMGDFKSVGDGVLELRFNFGPGYRVYFGLDDTTLVLLLHGGDKGSQRKDIKQAKELWADYLSGGKDGQKK